MGLKDLLTPEHLIACYDQCDAYDDDEYDQLADEMNHQDAIDELSTYIKENCLDQNAFVINVEGFGWRNTSGIKMSILENGSELLQSVLPRTQCTWKAYKDGNKLVIRNWHHDSPMGNEYYYIEPVDIDTFYEWKEENA